MSGWVGGWVKEMGEGGRGDGEREWREGRVQKVRTRTLRLTIPIHIIDPRAHIRVLIMRDIVDPVLHHKRKKDSQHATRLARTGAPVEREQKGKKEVENRARVSVWAEGRGEEG